MQYFVTQNILRNISHNILFFTFILLKMNTLELIKKRVDLGCTQEEFAGLAGVSLRTVQNWEAGKAIPKSKHAFLRNLKKSGYSNNSTNDSVINEPQEIYQNASGYRYRLLTNAKYKIIVKKIPVKAFGSYLSDYQNVDFMHDLEEVSFTVDQLGTGNYLCFEVEGDSMNGGNLEDSPCGAELLCLEYSRDNWKEGFKESKYGWVIVHKKTVLFKDIKSFDPNTGQIICASRSGLPNHTDFPIYLDDVKQILKVIKRSF